MLRTIWFVLVDSLHDCAVGANNNNLVPGDLGSLDEVLGWKGLTARNQTYRHDLTSFCLPAHRADKSRKSSTQPIMSGPM